MNLLEACRDENLFRRWFRDPATWVAWRAFISAAFGLPMTAEELAIFVRCTARARPPAHQADEAWIVAGRRSGKSFVLSLIAIYLATFKDWRAHLAPGEVATVMVVAADRKQSRVIMRYVLALLREVPMLAALVRSVGEHVYDLRVELANRVVIEVHTPNYRTTRGYTVVAALLDEVAFFRADDGAASPDHEVLAAIRPSLATVPGAMLLAASSPYARRGVLWDAHRRYYATEGAILVWQADTKTMNPTVSDRVIHEAEERDPLSAESEWFGRFRTDIEGFISREAVESCVDVGVRERPRAAGVSYTGFVDPSGGRQDAMTLAIAHKEDNKVAVLDLVREVVPPFDPASVVRDFAATLKSYGLLSATADRYAAEWTTSAFRGHGVALRPAEKSKSDLYRELLPTINSRCCALLDHPKIVGQLAGLERRVGRGGRDTVDHQPGSRDDVANAVAGALVTALTRWRAPVVW